MNIIAVDDEQFALERLSECIQEAAPTASLHSFSSSTKALEYASTEAVDVAFVDVEMPGMNGMELAKKLKNIFPQINIIFVTGYTEYSIDAFSLHASGYILKPYLADDIRNELTHLRYHVSYEEAINEDGIYIQCFGNFEAYLNGSPMKFKYLKTKEFLAYLVDRRGALCTSGEINAILFGDDVKTSYYQKLRADLKQNLPDDILIFQRGCIGLHLEKISCDYYDYLDG